MRNTNIVASFLILKRDNKIVLLKRLNTGYHDGDFSLIAGHVDAGETFSKAIIREANEEAGIILTQDDIQVAHVMHRKSDFDGTERVDIYFLAEKWRGDVKNTEPDKCSELTWFDIHQLPANIIPSVQSAIQHAFKGILYSEFGWEK